VTYRNWFLSGLLAASFLPAAISILNFDILNQSIATFTFLFSLLAIMGGAHVWLTLAYYTDAEWLAHFRKFPAIFFLAPALILISMTVLIAQPSKTLGLSVVYGVTFINLWHHSKQNWGVLSIVGKTRHANVSGLRNPLIYAWPFFIAAWCLQLPELTNLIGAHLLKMLSIGSAVAFAAFVVGSAWRGRFFENQDPIAGVFGIVLACYFMPLILLTGKPYALLIWAGAHALQYYLMVLISLSMKRRSEITFSAGMLAAVTSFAILVGLTFAS